MKKDIGVLFLVCLIVIGPLFLALYFGYTGYNLLGAISALLLLAIPFLVLLFIPSETEKDE